MILVIEILIWVALGVLAVPVLTFTVEVGLALLPARSSSKTSERPPCVVLVPAHDEAGIIGPTISTIRSSLIAEDQIVVIADNCTDSTASEARLAGARVLVREDTNRRGKGFALAAGVASLHADPPKVVVVLDADCEPEPGAIDRIVRTCVANGQPVQAAYVMRPPTEPTVGDRISALAFRFKNLIRPRGLARIGAPCLLTGSGMAFEYSSLRDCSLATDDIVEDMGLGIDLALAGSPPMAVPDAVVWSTLPGVRSAKRSQRTRWEHGHLHSIMRHAPKLAAAGLSRGRPSLIALALELSVPPMSLLLLGVFGLVLATTVLWPLGANPAITYSAISLAGWTALLTFLGWARFGQQDVRFRDLAFVPVYAIAKVPIYVRAITNRQKTWVRTARDS